MLRIQDVYKAYDGTKALGPLSFSIHEGECIGFVGLNGSGKTTALRILAGDLLPSSGKIILDDTNALKNLHTLRNMVGFLPELPPLYTNMTVSSYLKFAGEIRGMSKQDIPTRIEEVLDDTNTTHVAHRYIQTLSHGYKQRIGLAQAMIHKPRLLILDEPTRGLDPIQIVEMRDIILKLKQIHTVLVSSHVLTEISETCDRLLILSNGELLHEGTEADLASGISKKIVVAVRPHETKASSNTPHVPILEFINQQNAVKNTTFNGIIDESLTFEIESSEDIRTQLCKSLINAGHGITGINNIEQQLENIFVQLIQDNS